MCVYEPPTLVTEVSRGAAVEGEVLPATTRCNRISLLSELKSPLHPPRFWKNGELSFTFEIILQISLLSIRFFGTVFLSRRRAENDEKRRFSTLSLVSGTKVQTSEDSRHGFLPWGRRTCKTSNTVGTDECDWKQAASRGGP